MRTFTDTNHPLARTAILAALLAGLAASAPAQNHKLAPQGFDPETPEAAGVAWPGGGHISSMGTATNPMSGSPGIILTHSAVAYPGPTTWAGEASQQNLGEAAEAWLEAGTPYKALFNVSGEWEIHFDGVIDVSNGIPTAGATNYFEDRVREAESAYRALVRSHPEAIEGYVGLLRAVREQMVPHSYAGNNSLARTARERLIGMDLLDAGAPAGDPAAASREQSMLLNALAHFDNAAAPFIRFVEFSEDVALLRDGVPVGLDLTPEELEDLQEARADLLTAYARALERSGSALTQLYRLLYLESYTAPTPGNPRPMAATIADLERDISDLQVKLLVASAFRGLENFPAAVFEGAAASIGRLDGMKDAMERGELTFVGLDQTLQLRASHYDPHYVPFFYDPILFPGVASTYAGLKDFANARAIESAQADIEAETAVLTVDQNLAELMERLSAVNERFFGELGQLCGFTRETDATGGTQMVPDIVGALLPPELRPDFDTLSDLDRGQIGLQWLEIAKAEVNLQAAIQQKENIHSRMEKMQETMQALDELSREFIETVILPNGERLAELARDSGDVQARSIQNEARIRAQRAKDSASWSNLAGGLVTSIAASGGSGLGVLTGSVSGLLQRREAYAEAQAILNIAKDKARTSRLLADIDARRTEIATLEKASFETYNREKEVLRTLEALHSLALDAKSADLGILMAELGVNQEYARLATMQGRVEFLLQQLASNLSLVGSNPLNSPDFRIIRDREVLEAEDRFHFAQEWAFLAGRAASYVAFGSDQLANVELINAEILGARTGSRLDYLLDQLDAEINKVTLNLGARTQPMLTPISLRDYVFQNNHVVRDFEGELIDGFTNDFEAQQVNGVVDNSEPVSDGAWKQFLEESFEIDALTGMPQLRFTFALSPKRDSFTPNLFEDPLERRLNPLFSANRYGTFITHLANNPNGFGVRINIKGRGIAGIGGSGETIKATLQPAGASYVRGQSWLGDQDGQSIRIWHFGNTRTAASVEASLNNNPPNLTNPQLHERSPYNDRWVLVIPADSQANQRLLQQREKIKDIEIIYSLSSFTGN